MANELTTTNPTLPAAAPDGTVLAPVPQGVMGRLAELPARSRMMLGVGLAGLIAVVVALMLWSREGDYQVLYSNLSDKDGGAIIAQLGTMNVPYKYAGGGSAILVPSAMVHDVRLKLASAGLPKSSIVGYELMDNQGFGKTQFQERLNFQRGLEGELTRSILALASVQDARVHLALPNQNGFFREQQKPSASVLVTLHPGRTLERAQVAGIVHLVSSSVPEMNPKAVSVLDATGALLSGPGEDEKQGLDAQQLQYRHQVEQNYLKRVMDILEPVVGRDNLRATVTAELDFTETEQTQEQFRPNQGNEPAAVRSQQQSESVNATPPTVTGVPGASSNQPPTPPAAPVNGAAAPLQGAGAGAAGQQSRRDNVVNYEVDKTVRVTRNAVGTVKRLNAAVVVNHRQTTDKKGNPVSTPLTEQEIEKLTSLVQESVGYNKDRGDSVKVVTAPFQAPVEPKVDELPLWRQPWAVELLRSAGVPVALTLVAAMIVFGLVRPALKKPEPPPAPQGDAAKGTNVDAVVADEAEDGPQALANESRGLPALEAPKSTEKLDLARQLAKDNPLAVATVLRGWVSGEAAA